MGELRTHGVVLLCAQARDCDVAEMPFASRRSQAQMGNANAKKESKQGSEALPASAGDGVERMSIEHGAPPRPFPLARRN